MLPGRVEEQARNSITRSFPGGDSGLCLGWIDAGPYSGSVRGMSSHMSWRKVPMKNAMKVMSTRADG